jgi:cytochrome c oxidase subunit II
MRDRVLRTIRTYPGPGSENGRYNRRGMWKGAAVTTDTREEFGALFSVYFWVLVVTVAVVFAVVAFALLRYRRRRGHSPSTRSEAKLVEILYAAVLAVIVGVLVWKTFDTEEKVDALAASPGLQVDVTAFQWGWRFTYPQSGVTVAGDQNRPPTAAVPTGATVQFTVQSRDVIHAFWVPDLRFKKDAFPRFANEFDLTFARPGDYVGRCAEFCGLQHAGMSFILRAMSRDEFDAWLAEKGGGS